MIEMVEPSKALGGMTRERNHPATTAKRAIARRVSIVINTSPRERRLEEGPGLPYDNVIVPFLGKKLRCPSSPRDVI